MANKITLISLTLRNFKGIRNFILETNGGTDADVYGDNAAGKTTLFDAFTWLLFDKDSQNSSKFQLKTVDPAGNVLHNLEHVVEGVLLIDGRKVTLRKVFKEKWTKKRGAVTSEFTGHTTDHFIDDVPSSQAEYKVKVASIVDETIFKLLTSPTFFNEQWDDKKRRKLLLEICGDISDADVIASNKTLERLPLILEDRTIEGLQKKIKGEKAKINDELEKIPVRIDELNRSLPDLGGLNQESLMQQISALTETIEAKQEELSRVQSGGEIAVKEKRLREIESELLAIKSAIQGTAIERTGEKRQEVERLRTRVADIDFEIKSLERKVESNLSLIGDKKAEAGQLRKQWTAEKALEFEAHRHDENCPTCGQSLPGEQIDAAHAKALADFNRAKSERLEQINTRGKAIMAEVAQLEQANADISEKLEGLRQQHAKVHESAAATVAALEQLQSGMADPESDPAYLAKKQEASAVNSEILGLRSSNQGKIDQLRQDIVKLRGQKDKLEQDKAKFGQIRIAAERVADLEQQEKQLAAEYEKLEQDLFLTEEFIRTKVSLLEDKINSKFKYARFKLFETQVNGGVNEVCETLYDGVPYSAGLNNAARINVGLDIINTLSEHYGITAPIFIDNAEAVTRLSETHGQKIRLVVSEPDKQLRVVPVKTIQEAMEF